MAQAAYLGPGALFKSFINIKGNYRNGTGDTISISGPAFPNGTSITIGSDGYAQVPIKKKGTYTVSGLESNISASVEVSKSGNVYNVDVSFSHTVKVWTNASNQITLTSITGAGYSYQGTADDYGEANITVYRKANYSVSSTLDNTANASPSYYSVDSVDCSSPSGDTTTIEHAIVSNVASHSAGLYSRYKAYLTAAFSGNYAGGFRVEYLTTGYPTMPPGHSTYAGDFAGGATLVIDGLSEGINYYFTSYPFLQYYASGGSPKHTLWGTPYNELVNLTNPSFDPIALSSGVWIVPEGIRSVNFYAVGGGGGGGSAYLHTGGGGGGGYGYYLNNLAVTPGEQFYITVGAGGNGGDKAAGGNGSSSIVRRGGSSSSPAILEAGGGAGGGVYWGGNLPNGGNGGSGGGGGAMEYTGDVEHHVGYAGAGGSKGANGGQGWNGAGSSSAIYSSGGTGSGDEASLTFNGTYYGGGGGGGGEVNVESCTGGRGGDGGGGNGGNPGSDPSAGSAGSAGTGGGGGGGASGMTDRTEYSVGGAGGHGAVIVYL